MPGTVRAGLFLMLLVKNVSVAKEGKNKFVFFNHFITEINDYLFEMWNGNIGP